MEVWKKVYDRFDKEQIQKEETLFGLANGVLQSRAYFAEDFSGPSSRNAYLPPYALVDWSGLSLEIDGETIDLATAKVEDYEHQLNLKEGNLRRSMLVKLPNKHSLKIECTSFCSWEKPEIIGLRYSIIPVNLPSTLQLSLELRAPVQRAWRELSRQNQSNEGFILLQKNQDYVCSGMRYAIFQDAYKLECNPQTDSPSGQIRHLISLTLPKGSQTTIYKFTAHHHSGDFPPERLLHQCQKSLSDVFSKGFTLLLTEQAEVWRNWWDNQDFRIKADTNTELHFSYNLYQLRQLSGKKQALLPGRAFSWEQQQGQDWGQEVFLLPYYLWRGENKLGVKILEDRFNHLDKAQSFATKLGFARGSAFYPAQSWYGRETLSDHRLSEQQIFRNGLIAWAIQHHREHTGDTSFLAEKGAEILIALARFFADRVNYSPRKQKYVLLATTGPNEYESSVSNNWLTNYLCRWTLTYTVEVLEWLRENEAVRYAGLIGKTDLDFSAETRNWERIAESMFLPQYEDMNLLLQQDGFLDKEQVQELDTSELPLWQKWTEDRRLRSPFLQQADVLWAFYLFPNTFEPEVERTNYHFYAPKTVHEAPMSYALHSILAAKASHTDQADNFLQQAHKDLENLTLLKQRAGLHVSSLAGPYLSLVNGLIKAFVKDGSLHLQPQIPESWTSYNVDLHWRSQKIKVAMDKNSLRISNPTDKSIQIYMGEKAISIEAASSWEESRDTA